MQESSDSYWRIWVDTGGTFTDCLALAPDGRLQRVKVLSSSALRGTVSSVDGRRMTFDSSWSLVPGFAAGARLRILGTGAEGTVLSSGRNTLDLREELEGALPGAAFELLFKEQAPVLAARLITGSSNLESLPALQMRLATTRGTNALLERRGARTALLVTRGFGDLLRIGDQHRPDLFARRVRRPEPIHQKTVEVVERLNAQGQVIEPLDANRARSAIAELRAQGFESVAIAFMHSYVNAGHEQSVARIAREEGFSFVSASAELTPTIKMLPRAQTAVVDAYLSPVVGNYLDSVGEAVGKERLQVMTSAGGLADATAYRAKDSLLSGPAGGVVGAVRRGREHGFQKLIAFDMGGTSTDVSRYDGELQYRFSHEVGGATLAAPSLAIETVAAGGGSICRIDDGVLKVGPESAGAFPGPACYGAGGPLTVTDVNLLLGRLDPERFEIPIAAEPAGELAGSLLKRLGTDPELSLEQLLLGYLAIANQRMADAVRQISVRQGYDPSEYAMVAFGGAGGLHACEVAQQLGTPVVLWPREAGLLSALGLGAAVVERFAERQILEDLDTVGDRLFTQLDELAAHALSLAGGTDGRRRSPEDGPVEAGDRAARDRAAGEMEVRRRLAFMRLAGQESTLELEVGGSVDELKSGFLEAYQERFGYRPADRAIELESLRVVVSAPPLLAEGSSLHQGNQESDRARDPGRPEPEGFRSTCFDGEWVDTLVYGLETLAAGCQLQGPALVFDRHASFVVPKAWYVSCTEAGLVARFQ